MNAASRGCRGLRWFGIVVADHYLTGIVVGVARPLSPRISPR